MMKAVLNMWSPAPKSGRKATKSSKKGSPASAAATDKENVGAMSPRSGKSRAATAAGLRFRCATKMGDAFVLCMCRWDPLDPYHSLAVSFHDRAAGTTRPGNVGIDTMQKLSSMKPSQEAFDLFCRDSITAWMSEAAPAFEGKVASSPLAPSRMTNMTAEATITKITTPTTSATTSATPATPTMPAAATASATAAMASLGSPEMSDMFAESPTKEGRRARRKKNNRRTSLEGRNQLKYSEVDLQLKVDRARRDLEDQMDATVAARVAEATAKMEVEFKASSTAREEEHMVEHEIILDELTTTEKELESKDHAIKAKEFDCLELTQALAASQGLIAEMDANLQTQTAALQGAVAEKEACGVQVKDLGDRVTFLELSLDQATKTHRVALEEAQAKSGTFEATATESVAKLGEEQKKRKRYQALYVKTETAAKDQMGNARKAVVEAKSETKKMKEELEAVKAGQGVFVQREAEAKAAAAKAVADADLQRRESDSAKGKLEATISDLQAACAKLESDGKRHGADAQVEVQARDAALKQANKDVATAHKQLATLSTEMDAAKATGVEAVKDARNTSLKECTDLKVKLYEMSTAMDGVKAQLTTVMAENEAANKDNADLIQLIDEMEKQ